MSNKTTISSKKGDNKYEEDELEEQFLKCELKDLPIPKKELEKFQFEVREVMKSGCNLQIAEYSLLQYDIVNYLTKYKDEYNQYKDKFMKLLKDEIKVYFNNLKENMIKAEYEDDDDTKNKYEEEADEIMDENLETIESIKERTTEQIKEDLMNIFKKKVDESGDKDDFDNAKENYVKKRDALIESALRLVKKIVNDEKEYDKFYENYYKKKEDKNQIN
jgi:hypothetical protein